MSDRAMIGLYDGNTLKAVYCHNGGDRYDLGRTLLNHYYRPDQAAALIELGHLSSVSKRLMPMQGESHSFDKPNHDITVAYHRDRGEPLEVVTVPVEHGIMQAIQDTHIDGEFCYVYKDGYWTYLAGNSLRRLTEKNTTPKERKK